MQDRMLARWDYSDKEVMDRADDEDGTWTLTSRILARASDQPDDRLLATDAGEPSKSCSAFRRSFSRWRPG